MQIVRAKEGDVRDISICRRKFIESMRDIYSRENLNVLLSNAFEKGIKEELKEEEVFCLIGEKTIIGTVSLAGNQISGIYVNPEYISQGYPQKLLEFIEETAREKGLEELYVYAIEAEEDFYFHNNYEVYGEAYNFPSLDPTKFICMKKRL